MQTSSQIDTHTQQSSTSHHAGIGRPHAVGAVATVPATDFVLTSPGNDAVSTNFAKYNYRHTAVDDGEQTLSAYLPTGNFVFVTLDSTSNVLTIHCEGIRINGKSLLAVYRPGRSLS